jgi:amidohydrolase
MTIFRSIPLLAALVSISLVHAADAAARGRVTAQVRQDYAYLESLYKQLHSRPELSGMEVETSARIADELKQAGFDVTTKVGGHGVVGVLRNGDGPTVLLRTDLDGLPVKEQTGLPYASTIIRPNREGKEGPAMHACGHDMHMTVFVGTARLLAKNKDSFRGTIVMIGQPAEEIVAGAKAMLKDGLFQRFPKPDFGLALHVGSSLPTGTIGYVEGYALANSDAIDITIRGVGGHGAYPYMSKDPVVLAAQTILALQTIVSRETPAIEPAVLTVGSIHGGTKHNIIPDEVKLQLTLRSYSDDVRSNMIASVRRITRGLAQTAGLPEELMPTVQVDDKQGTSATYNTPELTRRWVSALGTWLGPENVTLEKPVMGAEDFGLYGRTEDKIPVCMLWLGTVEPKVLADGKAPPIHSPFYHPVPSPTIETGVMAFAAGVLDLLP